MKQFLPLFKLICDFVRRFIPGFEFSSVSLIDSFQCMLHVDKGNVGTSFIITLGDHTGGDLWLHGLGRFTVHNTFVKFDGNDPHATYPFKGERFSLVFFTCKSYASVSNHDREWLLNLGVPLPEPGMLQKGYPSAAERLDAAKKALPPELHGCISGEARDGDESSDDYGASSNDSDEVWKLSFEEEHERQKEELLLEAELEDVIRLSALPTPPVRREFDDEVVRQLCEMCHCCRRRAEQALAEANGNAEIAGAKLVEAELLD